MHSVFDYRVNKVKPVACVGAVRLFSLFSDELGQQFSKRKRLMLGKLDRVIELIANLEADGAPGIDPDIDFSASELINV